MRIGIDCRMAGTGEGIGRYVEELVLHLSKIDHDNDYFLIVTQNSKSQIPNFKQITNPKFKITKVRSDYYSFSEQTRLVWELLKLKLDLVHFPNFNVPVLYPGKYIVTIHDLIHHQYPGKKKSHTLHRLAYKLVIWSAIKRARAVIAVSAATKQDIVKTFGVKSEKIRVIYEGVDAKFRTPSAQAERQAALKKYDITKPFLLSVGVWRQYKNLPRLAKAFDIVKEKYSQDCQLVLAGKIDPFYPEIKKEVMAAKHVGDIRALGHVPDEDLNILYQSASVFLLPSMTEGFGLIGAEAQAAGAPVAASDISVLREVLGEGALYFDPAAPQDIAEKTASLLADQSLAGKLKMAGRQNTTKYNWLYTAGETQKIYLYIGTGKTFPLRTKSAGGVVFNQKNQVLVVNQNRNSWSLPKGHIDQGEDALTAAKREILEESGVSDLDMKKPLGSYERYRVGLGEADDRSERKTIEMFLFRTRQDMLNPTDPLNPEARWVDQDQVADLLTHSKDKEFFQRVRKELE